MRRTVLALLIAALAAACQQPEAPEPAPAPSVEAAPPEMPADAPPQEEVDPAVVAAGPGSAPAACVDDIGPEASARLVQRCIAVSPATRPPCNAANPCEMIQGEIDRACEMYGPGEAKPAECGA